MQDKGMSLMYTSLLDLLISRSSAIGIIHILVRADSYQRRAFDMIFFPGLTSQRCYNFVPGSICMQVFHPNIDLEGNICLNILREDWKPVLSINSVLFGLSFLFMVEMKISTYL